MIEPSDSERANWLDTTRDYVAALESALSAAEARVGVLEGLIRQMHDEYQADEQCDYVKINAYIEALHAALTQEPTS